MKSLYCKSNKIRPLEGFINIARTKSVTEAAKLMGLTQAAVSQQLMSLERELNTKLFQRINKRLHLTPDGTKLYELSTPRVQAIHEIYKIFIENTKAKINRLDIAANHTSILYILPELIKNLTDRNPTIEIMIRNIARDDAVDRLIREEIDLALYPMHNDIPVECTFLPIVKYDPVLIIKKDHPLATKEDISLQDVANYSIVRIDPHLVTLPLFEEIIQKFNLKSNIYFESADWEILKKFVKAGVGVAIISNICIEAKEDTLIARKIPKYFPDITYGILCKKGKERITNISNFLDLAKNQSRKTN